MVHYSTRFGLADKVGERNNRLETLVCSFAQSRGYKLQQTNVQRQATQDKPCLSIHLLITPSTYHSGVVSLCLLALSALCIWGPVSDFYPVNSPVCNWTSGHHLNLNSGEYWSWNYVWFSTVSDSSRMEADWDQADSCGRLNLRHLEESLQIC